MVSLARSLLPVGSLLFEDLFDSLRQIIGVFGAKALMDPETYKGEAISLAGDELKYDDMVTIFKEKTGSPPPSTFNLMARFNLRESQDQQQVTSHKSQYCHGRRACVWYHHSISFSRHEMRCYEGCICM